MNRSGIPHATTRDTRRNCEYAFVPSPAAVLPEVLADNATPRDTPPEPINSTRPVETFSVPCRSGAYIQASVWGKQIEYEGRSITVFSVTVRKSYKDATTGEWKNTNSFRGSELYCVHHVLSCAGTWIMNQRTETSTPF